MKKLAVFFLIGVFAQQVIAQKTIKVWVVRHAEKATENPKDKDPDLSDEGKKRAEALQKELKGQGIDSIFATNYKRTRLTGFPLADKIGISVKTYDAADQLEFVKSLLANAQGKKLLIIGHSNTVLELVEAFGAKRPLKELGDNDYDYLFEVTIKGNKAEVKAKQYGEPHRKNAD